MSVLNIGGSTRVLLFQSHGRIGVATEDGQQTRFLDFSIPGEAVWQFGPDFTDERGRRKIILSSHRTAAMSALVRGAPRRRLWVYDIGDGSLSEVLAQRRPSEWVGVSAVIDSGRRAVVNAIIDGEQRIYLCDLETEELEPVTQAGWGFHYCESLSPNGARMTWHVTHSKLSRTAANPYMPSGYSINVMDMRSRERALIAGRPGHLYFGPAWSPDGDRLCFLDCESDADPAHWWADVCVAHADGSSCRRITEGQCHWFGTSHGTKEARGGGSNMALWAPARFRVPSGAPPGFGESGIIGHTHKLPGSHPDVIYDPSLPDHEEFVIAIEEAIGGTHLKLLDAASGAGHDLTPPEEGRWDFRMAFAPEGDRVAFTRTWPGRAPEVWVVDSDGGNPRFVTRGVDGADFPRWLSFAEDGA